MLVRRGLLVSVLLGMLAVVAAGTVMVSGSSAATARRAAASSRSAVTYASKHRMVGRAGTPTVHLRGFQDFDLGPARLGSGNRSHGSQALMTRTPKVLGGAPDTTRSSRSRVSSADAPRNLGRLRKVPSLATLDSNTFESASGVYEAHVYTNTVNYRAANGKLEPINDALKRTGRVLVDRADSDRLRLPVRLNGVASISHGGSTVRLRLIGASRSARASVAGSVARYANAYPGTSVSLRAIPGSLEFSFSLANRDAARVFKLRISVPHGLGVRLRRRVLQVVGSHGQVRFQVPAPLMLEHFRRNLVPSYPGADRVRVTLSRAHGRLTLTYVVSRGWLDGQAAGRFPVVLDPQVTSSPASGADCTIFSNAPTSAADCANTAAYDIVGAGYGSFSIAGGSYVTMMNFPADPGGIPADSQVLGADLSTDVEDLQGNPVSYSVLPMSDSFTPGQGSWVYSNTATGGPTTASKWNCQGGDYEGCQTGSPTTVAGTGWFTATGATSTVSITALAQSWVDGSQPSWQYGTAKYLPLMLYPTNAAGLADLYRFGASNAPVLTIYYTPRLGGDPGSTIPLTTVDGNTSLGLNLANGDVQARRSDLDVPGTAGMNLDLSHSYNSESTSAGWSLDQPASLSSMTGVNDAEVLNQPDGSSSVWDAATPAAWGEGGVYSPPPGVNGSLCEAAPDGQPAAITDPSTGNSDEFYVGSNGQMYEETQVGSGWFVQELGGGGEAVAPNTSPTVIAQTSTDQIEVFYSGSNGEVWEWWYSPTGGWIDNQMGGQVAADSSPSAVNWGSNYIFYFLGANGEMMQGFYNSTSSSWSLSALVAVSAAPNSSVSAAASGTSQLDLFYVGSNGQLDEWYFNGSGWYSYFPGGSVAANTSPAAIMSGSGEYAFYVGTDGALHLYAYSGSSSIPTGTIGGSVEPNTSPSAMIDATGVAHVYYTATDAHFSQYYTAAGAWLPQQPLGGAVAPNTSPSNPLNPPSGNQIAFYLGNDGQTHEMEWTNSVAEWNDTPLQGQVGVSSCSPEDVGATWELTYYGSGQRLDFNSSGQLMAEFDRNGNVILYTYNTSGADAGLVSQITDSQGRTYTYTYYSGTSELEEITDNAGSRNVQDVWTSGQLTSDQDLDGNVTHYGYTSGLLTSIEDPRTYTTSISYPTPTGGAWLQVNITRPSPMTSPTTETTQYAY